MVIVTGYYVVVVSCLYVPVKYMLFGHVQKMRPTLDIYLPASCQHYHLARLPSSNVLAWVKRTIVVPGDYPVVVGSLDICIKWVLLWHMPRRWGLPGYR